MLVKFWPKILIISLIAISYLSWPNSLILAQSLDKIEVAVIEQFQTIAPGESLPVSVRLLNMGGSGRVDVRLTYSILDAAGNKISEESETVAVETTANFVKQVKIPADLRPGRYFLSADLEYPDQKFPAAAKIPFQAEYKFFGLFLSQLAILGAVIVAGIILIWLILYYINKPRRIVISKFEYKKIAAKAKPYYELISDIILTMRLHLGDKAVQIANKIGGLKISDQGEVLEINKEPAEIVTLLTVAFQESLNYKGLSISQKVINQRLKITPSAKAKAEYQQIGNSVNNVAKFFIKK